MMPLLPILEAVEREQVAYVVVGGLAVVMWGHTRFTQDLDIVVALDPQNLERAVRAFRAARLRPVAPVDLDSLLDPAQRRSWVEEKGLVAFALVDPALPMLTVDLLLQTPVPFEHLFRDSLAKRLSGHDVRVASLPHLIEMKRHSDREIDRSDIEALMRLHPDA